MNRYKVFFFFLIVALISKSAFAFKPMNVTKEQFSRTMERAEKIDDTNFSNIIRVLNAKLLIDQDKLDDEGNETVRLFEKILKTEYRIEMINKILSRIDFLKKIGTVPSKHIENIENFLKKYDIYRKEVFSKQDLEEELFNLKRVMKRAKRLIDNIVKKLPKLEIKE